jgi:hypothetical protein
MPSSSKKQHNFMEAIAHNKAFAKKAHIPQSVGQEFVAADKGKTFKRGGDVKRTTKSSKTKHYAGTDGSFVSKVGNAVKDIPTEFMRGVRRVGQDLGIAPDPNVYARTRQGDAIANSDFAKSARNYVRMQREGMGIRDSNNPNDQYEFKRGGKVALKKHEMNQAKELRRIADEEEHEAHEMKRGGRAKKMARGGHAHEEHMKHGGRTKKMAMGGGVDPRVAMAMMAAKRGRRPMAPAMGPMDNAPMAPAVPGMKHGGLSKAHHKHLAEHHLSMAEHHMAQHEAHGGRVKKMAKGGMAETMGPRNMGEDVEKGSNKHLKYGDSAVQKKAHTRGRNLGDSGKIEGIESEKNMKAFEKEGMKRGGKVHRFASGGHVTEAHRRGDGIAKRGHTKTKIC